MTMEKNGKKGKKHLLEKDDIKESLRLGFILLQMMYCCFSSITIQDQKLCRTVAMSMCRWRPRYVSI